ncbi:MAG TPA: hypothetical protein PKA06_10095 [Gemmatales bacterium]|nr:hypothetical protein [Gemmatales bacterium]
MLVRRPHWLVGWMALAVLLMHFSLAQAQLFTATVTGVDNLLDAVKYGMKLAGKEDMAQQIDSLLEAFLQAEGFKGLDTKKPMGVYLEKFPENPMQPPVVIYIPITTQNDFVEFLNRLNVTPSKEENGIRSIEIPMTGQRVGLAFRDNYAFLSLDEEAIKNPGEPTKFLTNFPANALFHVRVGLNEVPEEMKELFLSQLNEDLKNEAARKEEEDEVQYQARSATVKLLQQAITRLVKDAESITVTSSLDKTGHRFTLESTMAPKAGSPLHDEIRVMSQSTSKFSSLLDNAPGYLVTHGNLNASIRTELDKLLDNVVKKAIEEEKSIVKKAIAEKVYQALEPTLKTKNYEFVLSLKADGNTGPLTGLTAIQVKEGKKIEELIKGFVAEMKDKEREAIQLDTEKLNGVNLHVVTVPVEDEGAREMAEVFGEAKITLAFHDDYIIAALGKNANQELKKFISGTTGTLKPAPMQMEVHLKPFARFIKEAPVREVMEKVLSEPGSDKMTMTMTGGDKLQFKVDVSTYLIKLGVAIDEAKNP